MNAVHASDSREVASRELAFFMPKFRVPYVPGTEPPIERTLALIRPDALEKYGGKLALIPNIPHPLTPLSMHTYRCHY